MSVIRKILAAASALALGATAVHAQFVNVGSASSTPSAVFNIVDYGAKCDGSTNDAVAINAALTAARASTAFANGAPLQIAGPSGNSTQYCKITSGLNFTGFTNVNGSTTGGRILVSDIELFCSGAGVICVDASGSTGMSFRSVSIKGDTAGATMPEIGIQIGTLGGTSAAWHNFTDVAMQGAFAFADFYNVGAENVTYTNVMWQNGNSTTGPIRVLGAVTGGTTYTNGTYTSVPLTGGSGTGALATVVVAGAVVTTVTITYEGRDYKPADTLSATAANIGGTGSGFSVPVSTVRSLVAVLDGYDHWRASSTFQTFTNTPDAALSLTLNSFYNANIRHAGNGAGFWLGHTGGLRTVNSYCVSGSPACVTLYDNGNGQQYGMNLELNIETTNSAAAAFLLEGTNATQILSNFSWRGYHMATTEAFLTSAGITAVTINGASITEFFNTSAVPTFSAGMAALTTFEGEVTVPVSANWTSPLAFTGRLVVGTGVTYPQMAANGTATLVAVANGIVVTGSSGSIPALAALGAFEYLSSTNGLSLMGFGSALDVSIRSKNSGVAAGVPTNTANWQVNGALTQAGTVPTGTTGSCVASSFTGGAAAGTFSAAVCAGGTIILSAMPAVTTGYACTAIDRTTPADTVQQTASTTTSVTFKATTVAADVVQFQCVGY